MSEGLIGGVVGGGLGALINMVPGLSQFMTWSEQEINTVFPVALMSPADYLNMWRTDMLTDAEYYTNMGKLGYNKTLAYRYANSQQTLLDLRTYLKLDFLGYLNNNTILNQSITPARWRQIRDALQIGEDVYALYKQSAMYYPSVSELNQMYITDAFSDETAKRYNLDELLDDSVYKRYAKLGLDQDWTRYMWRSTWNYPSFYEAKYMYDYSKAHAQELGASGFYDDDFDYLMRTKNYPSYFRKLYKYILNTPITIAEISRMYEEGIITTDDQLRKLLLWEGRSDEQVSLLIPFIKKTYSPANARGMKHYTESMITELYMNGMISDAQFEQYLTELKYDNDSINVIKNYVKLKEILAQRSALKGDVLERYKTNKIDESTAKSLLLAGGFTQQQAQYIIDKEKVVLTAPHKKLSVSELTKMAGAKLITIEEYNNYLKAIGYSEEDINLLDRFYGFEGA